MGYADSRDYESCAATAAEIENSTGRSAMPYGVHVGRWAELDGLVDAVYERFGKVDALVNNAGMSPLYESLTAVPEKLFDAVLNLNLKGPFRSSALIGERMIAAGGGSIVNVSSIGSARPEPAIIPHAAAKACLNALTEGLALALGPSVRVNTLMAGPFYTNVGKHWDHRATEQAVRRHALQRVGRPPRGSRRRALPDLGRIRLHQRRDLACRRRHSLRSNQMAWDFSTDAEFEKKLDWVRDFVREEVEPLDVLFPGCEYLPLDEQRRRIVDPLKQRVREHGLWAAHLGPELGGQGFGAVKLTLLNEILGRTDWGPIIFGTQAPDTGNAEILARFGTQA